MKTKLAHSALVLALTVSAFAQEVNTGRHARFRSRATRRAHGTVHRRAAEAVIWGMPAVNAELMFQAMREAKA